MASTAMSPPVRALTVSFQQEDKMEDLAHRRAAARHDARTLVARRVAQPGVRIIHPEIHATASCRSRRRLVT
jgi:hypothetical protein